MQEHIQSIPQEDKEILERFFSYMISYESFGFVLFGEKPMAAGGFDTHFNIENALSEGGIRQHGIRLTWRTWGKYAPLFPSEKFILRLSKNPIAPSFYWIVLINKDLCLKCIKENLNLFKLVLGCSITPKSVLEDLAKKEDIFRDALKKHDGLLGILFGYGRHNSMTFQKKNETSKMAKSLFLKGKESSMNPTLSPFNPYNRDLFFIDLPRFAEDFDHTESLQLHQSYEATWKHLSKVYASKNFLQVSLEKLTSLN